MPHDRKARAVCFTALPWPALPCLVWDRFSPSHLLQQVVFFRLHLVARPDEVHHCSLARGDDEEGGGVLVGGKDGRQVSDVEAGAGWGGEEGNEGRGRIGSASHGERW